MTLDQIKAELRRSACEDVDPWIGVDVRVLHEVGKWIYGSNKWLCDMRIKDLRTLFLLVAEAIE